MELTFYTDLGESYAVEIDENMELENVMALLEAEVSPPTHFHSTTGSLLSVSSFPHVVRHN